MTNGAAARDEQAAAEDPAPAPGPPSHHEGQAEDLSGLSPHERLREIFPNASDAQIRCVG